MENKSFDYKEESKKTWTIALAANQKPTIEMIVAGAQLRMADSLELIAKNKQDLENRVKYLESDREWYRERVKKLEKAIAAYKGQITKLKKQSK